ncbi:MAG: hypothetical protein RIS09_67 [Actinomycetota bacterium]
MKTELNGWDLLTWRLAFEDKGIVPLVGAQLSLQGHVDRDEIIHSIKVMLSNVDILNYSLSQEEFPTVRKIEDVDVNQCVQVLHNQTNPADQALCTAIAQFSMAEYRPDLPLWRVYVVYKTDETLLFTFLHHAIADGRTALEMILRLCDAPIPNTKKRQLGEKSTFQELVGDVFRQPLNVLSQLTSTLGSFSSLISLQPQHTLTKFSERSHRNCAIQFSISRHAMKNRAGDLGVSIHDLSVALSLQIIQDLEKTQSSEQIRINVPVLNTDLDTLNEVLIARIWLERLGFDNTAQQYRERFKAWTKEPALSFAPAALNALATVQQLDATSFASHSDVTISSLPAMSDVLRLKNHTVMGIWPLVPTMGSAFNFTSIGYGDQHYFSCTYDSALGIDDNELRSLIRNLVTRHFSVDCQFETTL